MFIPLVILQRVTRIFLRQGFYEGTTKTFCFFKVDEGPEALAAVASMLGVAEVTREELKA